MLWYDFLRQNYLGKQEPVHDFLLPCKSELEMLRALSGSLGVILAARFGLISEAEIRYRQGGGQLEALKNRLLTKSPKESF